MRSIGLWVQVDKRRRSPIGDGGHGVDLFLVGFYLVVARRLHSINTGQIEGTIKSDGSGGGSGVHAGAILCTKPFHYVPEYLGHESILK